ncbi:MAG: ATPase, partial [Candidatus Dormibacteria bacterium]
RTEVFELVPDAAGLSTVTFEESQGVTMMRILSGYPSRELRDAAIASGMEGGLQAALDCLDDLLHPAG